MDKLLMVWNSYNLGKSVEAFEREKSKAHAIDLSGWLRNYREHVPKEYDINGLVNLSNLEKEVNKILESSETIR